jgi:hypothetical protein
LAVLIELKRKLVRAGRARSAQPMLPMVAYRNRQVLAARRFPAWA